MQSRDDGLSDEQLAFRQLCRDFVDDQILPWLRANRDREWNAPPHERWPRELLAKADAIGLRTLGLPEEYGGVPLDTFTQALMVEELGRGDVGFTTTLVQNWKVAAEFARHASRPLAEEWFGRFKADPGFLWANCITEPRGASDRVLPYDAPEASLQTRAVRRNGEWVINGVKHYVSNGGTAAAFIVYANTNPRAGIRDGVSSFLVPREAPGFSVGQMNEKIGHRMVINAELILDDCRVPEDYLLVEDVALRRAGVYLLQGRVLNAARALGLMQGAFEDTARYVQSHFQGGRVIIKHQVVAARVADMATKIETSRSIVYRAARAIDSGADDATQLALMAKVYCAEAVFDVARAAMELHGGAGVMLAAGIEKYLRDSTIFSHTEGTADISRFKIIKAMFPDTAGIYAGPEPAFRPDGTASAGSVGQTGGSS
ncbi:MAG: acyl-CoA dehydrogenase family protein [Actinomycetota bacterium]|nr:acyl-CoA dehydrogenase family protein [Actinomycetota bacterium]